VGGRVCSTPTDEVGRKRAGNLETKGRVSGRGKVERGKKREEEKRKTTEAVK